MFRTVTNTSCSIVLNVIYNLTELGASKILWFGAFSSNINADLTIRQKLSAYRGHIFWNSNWQSGR